MTRVAWHAAFPGKCVAEREEGREGVRGREKREKSKQRHLAVGSNKREKFNDLLGAGFYVFEFVPLCRTKPFLEQIGLEVPINPLCYFCCLCRK